MTSLYLDFEVSLFTTFSLSGDVMEFLMKETFLDLSV